MQYALSYQRKLPHYQPQGGVLFITTRLDFPIPSKYLIAINQYREVLRIQYEKAEEEPKSKQLIEKKSFAYMDEIYNDCSFSIDISQQALAKIIMDKLLSMMGDWYYLYAFTIMPNHIHFLIKPLHISLQHKNLPEIMKAIKGATSRLINLELNRTGTVWYREYYDYWVRDQQELINIIEYIRNNPVKAGLVNDPLKWPWTWLNPDLLQ